MASVKFRVTHNRTAPKAKRYRYALVAGNGQVLSSGEGYPTHQHVTRAINGLWKSLGKVFGTRTKELADAARELGMPEHELPPVPYTADSLHPGAMAIAKAEAGIKPAKKSAKAPEPEPVDDEGDE